MEILTEPSTRPSEFKAHEVQSTMEDSALANLATGKFK